MLPEESEGFTDRTESFLGKLLFPLVMVWYYRLLPGRSSLRLAQSFFYLHLYRAAENSDKNLSGLDKRIAFWCGFGQLLARVIPSPCV